MKIIVDTNIVFSAILNSNSRIGKILLNSKGHFQFFSCNYLWIEIQRHRNKLFAGAGISASPHFFCHLISILLLCSLSTIAFKNYLLFWKPLFGVLTNNRVFTSLIV